MSTGCLPSSFGAIWRTIWEEMWFEEFQDGRHLGYWNRMILAILNFHSTSILFLPSSLSSIRLTICMQVWLVDFQDGCHGGHLWYQNGTILAILNLHAALMPSTKFRLHPTYGSGADNNWRLSRWPPWQPLWIRFSWRCRKNVKSYWLTYGWGIDHGQQTWLGAKLKVIANN